MQLSVRNDAAAARAEAKGVTVIMNRCPKIEYGRLSGEIGWQGINSHVMNSRRPAATVQYQRFRLGGTSANSGVREVALAGVGQHAEDGRPCGASGHLERGGEGGARR